MKVQLCCNEQQFLLANLFSLENQLPIDFDLAQRAMQLCDSKVTDPEIWKNLKREVDTTIEAFK